MSNTEYHDSLFYIGMFHKGTFRGLIGGPFHNEDDASDAIWNTIKEHGDSEDYTYRLMIQDVTVSCY